MTAPDLAGEQAPIADLSYRNYDGPIITRSVRWGIIALAGIKPLLRKAGFWLLVVMSVLPYLMAGLMLWIASRFPGTDARFIMGDEATRFTSQFFSAFDGQQLWLFLLALTIGAGSIAGDTRTNAILIYLSKPITKGDYLLGKWMGIFLPLFALTLAPALLLFFWCLFAFTGKDGILAREPWLFPRFILAALIPAAVHAGLLVGISAWARTPRMAGTIYAAVYFVGGLIVQAVWFIAFRGDQAEGSLLRQLSVGGAIRGLAQCALDLTVKLTVGSRRRGLESIEFAPPDWRVLLPLALVFIAVGILAARARIRAVEVVRG